MEDKGGELKICSLVVQYCPIRGDIKGSSEKVLNLLKQYEGKPIDIMVLPECALTGYSFPGRKDMEHMAEIKREGPQFEFVKRLALQFKCYVAMGYMERETINPGSLLLIRFQTV